MEGEPMRILDEKNDRALSRIILYLTRAEASEFKDSLEMIIREHEAGRHEHISSKDYLKEVTICLYDPHSLEQFNERSKKLILNDT